MLLLALTLLTQTGASETTVAQESPRFENEIRAFEAADKATPPTPGSVLFIGSSSIRMWSTIATDFPNVRTLNRGFGGSWVSDSVRYVDRIVVPYRPSAIVFFAGTNDLADKKSPATVANDYREFVTRVRTAFPRIPIAFIAITPAPSRWAIVDKVRETNALIRAFSARMPGLHFIDTFPQMLDAKGGPRPELFLTDQLHMNAQGYAIWKRAVTPVLRKMLPARR